MKKFNLIISALAISLICPNITSAQSIDDEIKFIQAAFGMNKREAMNQYMALSDEMAAKFWPIYDAYEVERRSVSSDRMKIINDYLTNFENLTNEQANDIATRTLKNELRRTKLQSKYYKQLRKATNAMEATKFMQVDNYIHSSIRIAMSEALPFIGEK